MTKRKKFKTVLGLHNVVSSTIKVSSDGEIVKARKPGSTIETIKNHHIDVNGLHIVSVDRRKFYVHRLVALAWVPNYFDCKFVLFKDGDNSNLHYSNLEWSVNVNRKKRKNKCLSKLNRKQVEFIKESNLSGKTLAEIFGVSESTISLIKKGKRWN